MRVQQAQVPELLLQQLEQKQLQVLLPQLQELVREQALQQQEQQVA